MSTLCLQSMDMFICMDLITNSNHSTAPNRFIELRRFVFTARSELNFYIEFSLVLVFKGLKFTTRL